MTAARRSTVAVRIGAVTVGGGGPVVVQSMTNTDTADVEATARQVRELAEAGSELVRVTVNTDEAAAAVAGRLDMVAAARCHGLSCGGSSSSGVTRAIATAPATTRTVTTA